MGCENFASGIGGVVVVAYLSALCNLSFTATQFALLSAAASIVGRFVTGTTAGGLIEQVGYVNFYLLTTVLALPGVVLFAWMMKAGLVAASISETDVRRATQPASDGSPRSDSEGDVHCERRVTGDAELAQHATTQQSIDQSRA